MLFLCCQLSALYVYFCVALSESSCREKETLFSPFCKHCDESVFSDLLSFCSNRSLLSSYSVSFLLLPKGLVQLNCKEKAGILYFGSLPANVIKEKIGNDVLGKIKRFINW